MGVHEDRKKTSEDQKELRGRLTADRTFVIQFRERTDGSHDWMDGRIEHISSGRALLFHDQEDLLGFLKEVLGVRS